ncbi:MAG: NAD(P)/FAD-dependent oxidoreductase [Gemmatimonadales bacterium]|nr:MAG: NAD(P)/FAD-dependent oxidoreductase [Gemmatimonadales bacterium]
MSKGREVVEYLIVGGGMTADAAVRGIRSVDPEGGIRVLCAEPHPPYDRPPLSKGLWKGESEDRIGRDTADLEVDLRLGTRAVRLETDPLTVVDDGGTRHSARKILLATGARPRRLSGADDGVTYFRTLDDYRRLREGAEAAARIAVVGGGFIGCEVAASLAGSTDAEIHLFFPEKTPLGGRIPPPFGGHLARVLEELGIQVHAETGIQGVQPAPDAQHRLQAADGASPDGLDLAGTPFDLVVAGLGVEPCTELADEAGLTVDGGIVVDHGLQTSLPGVWAAGDVTRFPLSLTGRREMLGHEEHANESGMMAGQAMAGESVHYDPLPYVYSGMGDLTLEVVGLPSPDDEAEAVPGESPLDPGFARYSRDGRTTGVLIWNRPGRAFKVKRSWGRDGDEAGPRVEDLRDVILGG